MRPVGLVSLPVLSRLQDDPEKLREAVAKCLRTTLLIAVPVLLVVLAASDEIIAVLGTEWEQAGIALQFLCLVGIGKAISFFTGPVLFAANRPRFRAIMLWALAAVSTAIVVVVGELTRDSSVDDQVLGMSLSRALLFLLVLVPVNLAIVSHMTGLRLRTLLPALPGPLLSGGAAIAVAVGLRALGAGRAAAALRAASSSAARRRSPPSAVLLALEPDLRGAVRRLVRAIRRRRSEPVPERRARPPRAGGPVGGAVRQRSRGRDAPLGAAAARACAAGRACASRCCSVAARRRAPCRGSASPRRRLPGATVLVRLMRMPLNVGA